MNGISNRRWWTKKLARAGMAIAGAATVPVAAFDVPRIYALTYHRIGNVPRDPFCVSVGDFENQVRALSEQGRAISLADLEAFVHGERTLANHSCLITIDDGMVSTLEAAAPILERFQVGAAVFVSSNLVGRTIPGAEEPYMSWSQLRELAAIPLISIGSHAHTHRSLGAMTEICARVEMETSKRLLEDELGQGVRTFAYPFGTVGDFDARTDAMLSECGYTTAFNAIHGSIRAGMNPISLPRVKVEGGEGSWIFELISRGATVPWQVVDRNLWRMQRVRAERV